MNADKEKREGMLSIDKLSCPYGPQCLKQIGPNTPLKPPGWSEYSLVREYKEPTFLVNLVHILLL